MVVPEIEYGQELTKDVNSFPQPSHRIPRVSVLLVPVPSLDKWGGLCQEEHLA